MTLSRRSFLGGATGLVVGGAVPAIAGAADGLKTLRLASRQVEIGGRAATRYGISDATGTFGLTLEEGDMFNVRLENGLGVESGIHWHGMTCPWRQDGVPYISQPPIDPGGHRDYKFPATPAGTRFMHSHFGLQEQDLLAAPLIIREASLQGPRPAGGGGSVRRFLLEDAGGDLQRAAAAGRRHGGDAYGPCRCRPQRCRI